MSSDSDNDDDGRRMRYSTENDFEGGEWRAGEFYFKNQRKGKTMNRDEQVYGVFDESDSGDENEEFSKRKRVKKDQANGVMSVNKPVSFVGSSSAPITHNNPPQVSEEVDESTDSFHKIIGSISQSSSSNEDFRKFVQASTQQQPAKPKAVAAPAKDLGQWEKHTKGFGKKMLEKMGFTGRLGAKENGISSSLQVKVRPNQMGLGFGDFVESTVLEANKKLEAELHGKEYVPPAASGSGGKGKPSKGVVEDRAASKSWKLGGQRMSEKQLLASGGDAKASLGDRNAKERKSKSKKKGVQFSDMLIGSEVTEANKQVILDMRGPQPTYVTDTATLNAPMDKDTPPMLGQELLYNINLVVDMMEMDLLSDQRRLSTISNRIETLEQDSKALSTSLSADSERLENLQIIDKALDKMGNAMKTYTITMTNGQSVEVANATIRQITREDVIQGFVKLTSRCPEESVLLGLIDIIPSFAEPIIAHEVNQWNPKENSMHVVEVYVDWMSALSVFEVGDEVNDPQGLNGPSSHASSVQVAYSSLQSVMEKHILPRLRRYLTNEWDVKDEGEAESCSAMLKGLKGIFTAETFRSLVDMIILPRLTRATQSWNPMVEVVPIDKWIVPWTRVLGSVVSVVFPDIRRKIAKALESWDALDHSAFYILQPWKDIFDKTSMTQLLVRSIIPKLVSALRNQSVEPDGQSVAHFNAVMVWRDVLPREHMLCLLEGEFFPKWFTVLCSWLSQESVDFAEVSMWYTSWKQKFPADMVDEPLIINLFSQALDIMSHAITTPLSPGHKLQIPTSLQGEVNYFQLIERKHFLEATERRLEELRRGDFPRQFVTPRDDNSSNGTRGPAPVPVPSRGSYDVTFKEVVEEFAARNGVTFTPKLNNAGQVVVTDGKPLWTFADKISCYIDQNVVFIRKSSNAVEGLGAAMWTPVALETLLEMLKGT